MLSIIFILVCNNVIAGDIKSKPMRELAQIDQSTVLNVNEERKIFEQGTFFTDAQTKTKKFAQNQDWDIGKTLFIEWVNGQAKQIPTVIKSTDVQENLKVIFLFDLQTLVPELTQPNCKKLQDEKATVVQMANPQDIAVDANSSAVRLIHEYVDVFCMNKKQ